MIEVISCKKKSYKNTLNRLVAVVLFIRLLLSSSSTLFFLLVFVVLFWQISFSEAKTKLASWFSAFYMTYAILFYATFSKSG